MDDVNDQVQAYIQEVLALNRRLTTTPGMATAGLAVLVGTTIGQRVQDPEERALVLRHTFHLMVQAAGAAAKLTHEAEDADPPS